MKEQEREGEQMKKKAQIARLETALMESRTSLTIMSKAWKRDRDRVIALGEELAKLKQGIPQATPKREPANQPTDVPWTYYA